jgi:hypothetical protein
MIKVPYQKIIFHITIYKWHVWMLHGVGYNLMIDISHSTSNVTCDMLHLLDLYHLKFI